MRDAIRRPGIFNQSDISFKKTGPIRKLRVRIAGVLNLDRWEARRVGCWGGEAINPFSTKIRQETPTRERVTPLSAVPHE